MESANAVAILAALAQPSRLAVFRLLVQAGPNGMPAGEIAERLELASTTLSFHLKALSHGGLAQSRQDGRFLIYSANFDAMNALIAFLTENCCMGSSCDVAGVACKPATTARTRR